MSASVQFPVSGPMDVSRILNRVFHLLRANLKVFVKIASVPPVVMYGLLGMLAAAVFIPLFSRLHHAPSPPEIARILLVFVPLAILIFVLYWLVFALYLAAGSHAAVQADYGALVTFSESYSVAWSRAGRYFLLLLIIYAICFFPSLLIQLLMFAAFALTALHHSQPNPLLFLVFPIAFPLQMGLLVLGFLVALRLSLAFPASVMENLTAVEAVKRSNALTRGARLKIFLVLLIIYAATYLAMLVLICGLAFLIAIGMFALSGSHVGLASPVAVSLAVLAGLAFVALMVLFMAVSWAGFTTALCVIYNDQRRILDSVVPAGAPA